MRASSIGTFQDCEFKYFLEYVVGIPSKAGQKALLGTIVHHVLEIMARAKKTNHHLLKDKYTDPEYLLKICWERYRKEEPETFSKFDEKTDYKFCQKQIYAVLNSQYNPLYLNIVDTEKQFDLEIRRPGFEHQDGNASIRGTIDLVTELDSDTLQIIDYKTGKRSNWLTGEPKEFEDFFKDTQLRMYDLATSVLYPNYKYRILTIIFTREGGPFTVSFDLSDREKYIDDLRKIFNQIKATDKPTRLKDDFQRKNQHWKCKFVCPFGTRENFKDSDCQKFYKILSKNSLEKSREKLYNITIGETNNVSRRNDYGHNNIQKGVIT